MTDPIEIAAVTEQDVELVAPLFDAYRVWYGCSSDLDGARNFLTQRLRHNESIIFAAIRNDIGVGFTQLYPTFSSVSMGTVWILNDLFVIQSARRQGVGTLLLETAAQFGRETGAIRLELQTGLTNTFAQAAYEKHGWVRDDVFCYYSMQLE